MTQATWGSTTAKSSGGEGDPNILKLGDATRFRLVEGGARKWRQHFIESTSDPDQGRSCVCPKGPDGRDSGMCPCCMKPVAADGKTQLFAVSRRYATNVWDYESSSVKVLIAGPQVFEQFDAIAAVGMDPTEADFIVHKMGKGKSTSYKVVRGNPSPLPTQITPDMLHDLDKYDTPTSTEKIFELLEEMGWDYDALETPSFTLDQAEAFVMPYGKHKGMTVEQLVANDTDYCIFIHRSKKEQGSYGDPVFVALQTVLEDRGEAEALDGATTIAPRPQSASAPAAAPASIPPTTAAVGMVTLVGPDGTEGEFPEAAKDGLLAAGFYEPAPAIPGAEDGGLVTLIAPDGSEHQVPEAAAGPMEAAGFTRKATPESWAAEAAAPAEPADTDVVQFDVGGTKVEMPYGQGKALVAAGTATLLTSSNGSAPAEPVEPPFQLPGDEETVNVLIGGNPVPMAFAAAKATVATGAASFEDTRITAALDDDGATREQVQTAAAADPTPAGGSDGVSLDKALTQGPDAEGQFTHPALPGKAYKTKGAVTQALNKLAKEQPTGAPAPAAAPAARAAPAQAAPSGTGRDALLELAKTKMAAKPELTKDFKVLLELFQDVAGKRNITEFDEAELQKLVERLDSMD